jgi:hypothetical protein
VERASDSRSTRTTSSKLDFDRSRWRTPRSAAYAGIVFSVLVFASLVAVFFAVPRTPADSADLLTTSPKRKLLLIGLSLIPFAAVAFLWFVGVIRDRIGDREDKFFATVFLGSGLLFVGMLLVGEAMASGMVLSVEPNAQTLAVATPDWWTVTRHISHEMLEAALQMAGAFTTASATLLLRTGAAPRWLTLSGTVIAVLLFFATFVTEWIGLLFPVWIFVLSVYVLVAARRENIPAVL